MHDKIGDQDISNFCTFSHIKLVQGPPYLSAHYISSHTDYKWLNLTTKFDMLGVLGVVNMQEKICSSIPKIVDFF